MSARLFSNVRNTRNKTRQPLKMRILRRGGKARKVADIYFILTRRARFSMLCEKENFSNLTPVYARSYT